MDTLRVGGSSFVFGEHTNKVFTILEFDENTQKLELILPIQAYILSLNLPILPVQSTLPYLLYLLPHPPCPTYPHLLTQTHPEYFPTPWPSLPQPPPPYLTYSFPTPFERWQSLPRTKCLLTRAHFYK